jgi:hypothetical protein
MCVYAEEELHKQSHTVMQSIATEAKHSQHTIEYTTYIIVKYTHNTKHTAQNTTNMTI